MVLRVIYSTSSPFARKVRIALAEKAIPFELELDEPYGSDSQTTRHNPLGKLPILLKHNGTSVYGSHLILEWIEAEYPPPDHPPLFPQVKEREILAKQIEVLADGIAEAAVLLFFEQQREHPSTAWMNRQRTTVENGLRDAHKWLHDREFILTSRLSVADIALGSTFSYIRLRFAEDWKTWTKEWPNLQTYSDRLEQRKSFRDSVLTASSLTDKVV